MKFVLFILFISLYWCLLGEAQINAPMEYNEQYELKFKLYEKNLNDVANLQLKELISLYKSDSSSKIVMRPMIEMIEDSLENERVSELNWDRMQGVINSLLDAGIPRVDIVIGSCGAWGIKDHLILSVNQDEYYGGIPPPFRILKDEILRFNRRVVILTETHKAQLELFVAYLSEVDTTAKLVLVDPSGMFCFDTTGIKERQWLRLNNCADYLFSKGININRIIFYGMGYLKEDPTHSIIVRLADKEDGGPTKVTPPYPNLKR